MVNSTEVAVTKAAERLLRQYGFDLAGETSANLLDQWLRVYPPRWIRLAIIEALYQGRYKAICVGQLLAFWLRRGDVQTHFNSEFETMICRNLPRDLTATHPEQPEIARPVPPKTNHNLATSPRISVSHPPSPPNPIDQYIDQFQPQAPAELTTHFTEKLNAIAQAWKTNQTSLETPIISSVATPAIKTTTAASNNTNSHLEASEISPGETESGKGF